MNMDINNARTRLRRTFHYPTDESSNGSTPEVLDEEGMFPGVLLKNIMSLGSPTQTHG